MANSVTIRTSAPGAKQAAGELAMLKGALLGTGTSATAALGSLAKIGGVTLGASVAFNTLTDAAGKVSQFLGDSIMAASDLNETISKSQNVFGPASVQMEEWGETAAHAFGLSKGQALDAATTFGGLFKTVGDAADVAGGKARQMTELGADLASFFNTDMQTALESLRSGLAGEAEPMRKFNVFLSEAAVNAELLATGQEKVNGKWTESQKVNARLAIIMKQTSDAHGDFARTQDGLANSTREFAAALEDLKVDIGENFLGATQDGVAGANDFIKKLQELTDLVEGMAGMEEFDARNGIFQGIIESAAKFAPGPVADIIHENLGIAVEEAVDQAAIDARDSQETRTLGALVARGIAEGAKEQAERSAQTLRDVGSFLASEVTERSMIPTMRDRLQAGYAAMRRDSEKGARDIMDGLVDGIRGNQDFVADAMEDLTFAMNNPLKQAKEIARIEGALTGQRLANGLNSSNEFIRNAALEAQRILIERWEAIMGRAWTWGQNTTQSYAGGLNSINPFKGGWASRTGQIQRGQDVLRDDVNRNRNNGGGANRNNNGNRNRGTEGTNVRVNVSLSTRQMRNQIRHDQSINADSVIGRAF
jgi:ubiquinone biosynthesis protein UbiJ